MRIHIVARDFTSDQILARLAAELATDACFTVSATPDPAADANYFFPYLERAEHMTFNATPTGAWFTHRDDQRPEKVSMWHEVAASVDVRLTSAPVYLEELQQYGLTLMVMPPLDREKFKAVGRSIRPMDQRVIGTSGFVYPGGRKGEAHLERLTKDFPQLSFVASGHGWPVPTTRYPWNAMQRFYAGLDVYVCTSEIEGVGYGPLEAMACGIPVVVPRHVGVFDELPALENLHRYTAGDYADLKRAVTEALSRLDENALNIDSLRGATARFTLEAWIETHQRAFERLLYDIEPAKHHHPWAQRAGVYYVAYGDPARECARKAIQSAKAHLPEGIEVALVSDTPLNAGEDIFVACDDQDIGARSVKTQIYDLAPAHWDYVVYLDADTEIVADITFLFQILVDGWEAFFCINPAKYVLAGQMRRPDNQEECIKTFATMGHEEMLQLNGGVFGFRRSKRTQKFFRHWHAEWQRYGKRDQAALNRVLYTSPLRLYVLGNEWNTITRYIDAERTAGILHYPMMARRWRGVIDGRLDSSEAWAVVHPGGRTPA